jgi:cell division protein FtsL
MPLENILLITCLVLVAIVAFVLLSSYYKAEEQAKRDLAQLKKEAQHYKKTEQQKKHDFFRVGKE